MKLFSPERFRSAPDLLRVVVSGILIAHGAARIYYRTVDEFGVFLDSSHFPAGPLLAWAVTLVEVIGGCSLLLGIFRRPLSLYFIAQLLLGIGLVHAQYGFFVVGHGRNGIEYSLLLIASLIVIARSKGN
ncbi:MAG: DoxX family protein [Ignavibacteria bacterium]|nr:DoxX family protein [Ignavibacteria bacterium]